MGIEVDLTELNAFSVNLGKIASKALPEVDSVIKKGAQNIKEELVSGARASTHFKGMAGSISYDSTYSIGSVSYSVGPDKSRRGGALGNIFYFGTSRGGGTGDLDGPLRNEEPRTYKHLQDLVDKLGDSL